MKSHKPKIFLAPVSSNKLYENYQRTVMVGVDKIEFFKYEHSLHYEKFLLQNHTVRIWGIKSTKLTPYNRASINDVILFYHKGFIVGKAIISFKDNNLNLSNELWGNDKDKITGLLEYWENLVFMEKFGVIKLDFKILIEYASFSPKASVRGFNEYSQKGVENIYNKYGSIDKFLEIYK